MPVPLPEDDRLSHFLKFTSLPSSGNSLLILALAWRFTDETDEAWTSRINAFKEGDEDAVRGACSVISRTVKNIPLRKTTVVVSAIPSRENQTPYSHPLARLAGVTAKTWGCELQLGAFQKTLHQPLHTINSRADRDAEVREKYTCNLTNFDGKVVIVDDIATRGSTIGEITRALHLTSPNATAIGLVLGKAERRYFAQREGHKLDNNHLKEELIRTWDPA